MAPAGGRGRSCHPPPRQALRLLSAHAGVSLTLAGCAWHLPPGVQLNLLLPVPSPASGWQCWHAAALSSVWPEALAAAIGASWRYPRPTGRSSTSFLLLPEPQPLRPGPARPADEPVYHIQPCRQTTNIWASWSPTGKLGRDWMGLGRHGEGNRENRGGSGPYISESPNVLGQSLRLHQLPAALTQPLCSCFYLLGQALA